MINAVIMNENDNVVTVTKKISASNYVSYIINNVIFSVVANSDIPIHHKIAVKNLEKGDAVIKYGETIGFATKDIEAGHYVHTHNLSSNKMNYEEETDEV